MILIGHHTISQEIGLILDMSIEEIDQLKIDIDAAFESVFEAGHGITPSLADKVASKLYELKVLGFVLTFLAQNYELELVNPSAGFKGAPGPVNNRYTYIRVKDKKTGEHLADIRTDTEFVGLSSYVLARYSVPLSSGEYHELDIMVCVPNLPNGVRPTSAQVFVAVECKHWASIPKKLLREILGVRRELSFHSSPSSAVPVSLGRGCQNSNPPSEIIFAVSNDGYKLQNEWRVPAERFEIDIWDIPV